MDENENAITILRKCLAKPPDGFTIPAETGQEILGDFIESTTSSLEQLEGAILAFESGQSADDFVTAARRILHNIKGESGMMDMAEISNLCHHAESLLYHDAEIIPIEVLFSVKDWLTKAMRYLKSVSSELAEHIFQSQCLKSLWSAQTAVLDLGHGTSDAQAIEVVSSAMIEIGQLLSESNRLEIQELVNKVMGLLKEIKQTEQGVISETYREDFLDIFDAIKERTLIIVKSAI